METGWTFGVSVLRSKFVALSGSKASMLMVRQLSCAILPSVRKFSGEPMNVRARPVETVLIGFLELQGSKYGLWLMAFNVKWHESEDESWTELGPIKSVSFNRES